MIFGNEKAIKMKNYSKALFILALILFLVNPFLHIYINLPAKGYVNTLTFEPGGYAKVVSTYNISAYLHGFSYTETKQIFWSEFNNNSIRLIYYYFILNNSTDKKTLRLPGKVYIKEAKHVYSSYDLLVIKYFLLFLSIALYIYGKTIVQEEESYTKVF